MAPNVSQPRSLLPAADLSPPPTSLLQLTGVILAGHTEGRALNTPWMEEAD